MAVKASAEITVRDETDVLSLVPWYALTQSATAPTKPSTTQTSAAVPSPWTTAEPSFDPAGGTRYLYTCIQTRWKDGSCTWDNNVQLSSAYEQAKQAWNKANAAYSATQPIASRTYTGIIGTADNAEEASFYFAKVHPDDYNGTWRVKLRIEVTAPATYQEMIEITISGRVNAFMAYDSVVHRSTAALAIYFINLYRAKQAGITAGKGHALGFGLRASTNPTNATYARTITVDVLEQTNCTVQLLDTAVKYANMDGTGTTNYEGLTELGVANNGQNATNNSNTSYSQQSPVKAGANGVWGYSLIMQAADGRWNSIYTASSWNGTGTGKSRYTGGFVLGRMLYSSGAGQQTSASGTTSTYYRYNTDVTTSTTWDVYPFDMRYSTNCAQTLVAYKPVYLVGTVGSDGLFYLDSTWWTQALPTSANGKVYVYVGESYSTYQVYLASEHTALVYHDGGIKTYQQMLSDEAAKVAGNYIVSTASNDVWIHTEDHGPNANGNATANTYGWRIGSVFELVRAGLSYLKMWVDNSVAKVRVGLETAGHSVFSPDGMEVFTDADTSVAEFGAEGYRVGDESALHQVGDGTSLSFRNGSETVAYVSTDKFYSVNSEVEDAFYIGDYSIRNASDGKLVIGLRR